jgi:hypothetical protein
MDAWQIEPVLVSFSGPHGVTLLLAKGGTAYLS